MVGRRCVLLMANLGELLRMRLLCVQHLRLLLHLVRLLRMRNILLCLLRRRWWRHIGVAVLNLLLLLLLLHSIGVAGTTLLIDNRLILLAQLRFDTSRYVGACVLAQMILAVETLAAFIANVTLLTGVDDKVQRQLFLSFERFQTNSADERSLWIVTLFVACEVIFALQCRITDVTDKATLQIVTDQMLFEEAALWIGHLTLGTAVQYAAVEGSG